MREVKKRRCPAHMPGSCIHTKRWERSPSIVCWWQPPGRDHLPHQTNQIASMFASDREGRISPCHLVTRAGQIFKWRAPGQQRRRCERLSRHGSSFEDETERPDVDLYRGIYGTQSGCVCEGGVVEGWEAVLTVEMRLSQFLAPVARPSYHMYRFEFAKRSFSIQSQGADSQDRSRFRRVLVRAKKGIMIEQKMRKDAGGSFMIGRYGIRDAITMMATCCVLSVSHVGDEHRSWTSRPLNTVFRL